MDIQSRTGFEKLSKNWVVSEKRPAGSIYIPPNGTRELPVPKVHNAPTRAAGVRRQPEGAEWLLTPFAAVAFVGFAIVAIPVLLIRGAARSMAPGEKPSEQTLAVPAGKPSEQTPVTPAPEAIGSHDKYLLWMAEIASNEQYLSELDASFIEAFKIARRAQADRPGAHASDSESENRNTAASEREKFVLELGLDRIAFLIPDDGTLPYLTTCARARVTEASSTRANFRTFETCYSTQIAMEDPVSVKIDGFKAALALHAHKLAEMQVNDMTVDVQKSTTAK
jgi:hypothetical protein